MFDSFWQPMQKFLQLIPDFEQLTASHTHEYLQGTHVTLLIFKPFKCIRETASLAQSSKHFLCFCNCCPKFETKFGVHLMLCDNKAQDRDEHTM
jgi:hypothetical protein